MDKRRVVISIYGQVQGVFFRSQARQKAEQLGITGHVENRTDGSVYIVAEGDYVKLQEFIRWNSEGPRFALIEKINVEWEKATGVFNKFEVR